MIPASTSTVNIPVEISQFVVDNDLVKPFAVLLYLKMHSSGKIHEDSEVIQQMKKALKIKTLRSFKKYVDRLIELNWVGYNKRTGIYFIRSFDYIRFANDFKKRQATKFHCTDLENVRVYLAGAIICANINRQKHFFEFGKRVGQKAGTHSRKVAKQPKVSSSKFPKYYGLCNKSIGMMLACGPSRARKLKQLAQKAGYLKAHPRFHEYCVIETTDYQIRPQLKELLPENGKLFLKDGRWIKVNRGKLRLKKVKRGGVKKIAVLFQLHDEIVPLMALLKVDRFSSLAERQINNREKN